MEMKKAYVKPDLEYENYELDAAIATGCTYKVNLGPGDMQNDTCSDYAQPLSAGRMRSAASDTIVGSFYEGSCSCYLSAGGEGLTTS